MARQYGLDALKYAAFGYVNDQIGTCMEYAREGSPIEQLLITAVEMRCRLSCEEYLFVGTVSESEEREHLAASAPDPMILVRPQAKMQLKGGGATIEWRVDFLIHGSGFLWKNSHIGWRKLIVECDGHEFHERTKEQAKRDRSRDRAALLAGYDLLRFTGSEIWNDAWGCAGEVQSWAEKGLA